MGQESESSVLDHPCSPRDLKEAPLPRPSLLPLRMGWSCDNGWKETGL